MDYETDTTWVRGLLHPGENLLWTGRPGKGHLLRKEDAFQIPFSLLWCGFAIFWEAMVLTTDAPWFFKLWGVPFVLVGLYLVGGRFLVELQRRKKTAYALTNQRLIERRGATVNTVELVNLPPVSVVQRADGTGDIRLGEDGFHRRCNSFGVQYARCRPFMELRNIPDVNRVEYRLTTAVEQARRAASS